MGDLSSGRQQLPYAGGNSAERGDLLYRSVYIRPVIGKNGERLFVTHTADGVPISLDLTLEAALARAQLQNQTAQPLH